MRKIKHGKLSAGCADSCCLKLEGLSVRLEGGSILETCPSTSTAGRLLPSSAPTGRESPPCSAVSWAR